MLNHLTVNPVCLPEGTGDIQKPSGGDSAQRQSISVMFDLVHLGVNHCILPPGAISALKHFHQQDDELILVLAGQPTLWTDNATRQLSPGDVVGFGAGVPVAHQLINKTEEVVHLLEISSRVGQNDAVYPHDSEATIKTALGLT